MIMLGRKHTVKKAEAVTEAVKEPQIREAGKEGDSPGRRRNRHGKRGRQKKHSAAALLLAAADPKKRAAMSKGMMRRQKRAAHLAAAVRLVIRYLNARDRRTIYRNK